MEQLEARCVLDIKAICGEGPTWDASRELLTWVDIDRATLYRYNPASGNNESWTLPCEVGFAARTLTGDYIVGTRDGLARFDPAGGGYEVFADPEPHEEVRFNDGKCDARGRLWAGTMADSRVPECALYRIDHDLSVHKMVEGVTVSNGLCWNPAGDIFYYIDSSTRRIDAFDFDGDKGKLANRRTIVHVPESLGIGKPDGMEIDAEGMLWTGMWGGKRVVRWNPKSGERLAEIHLPCELVTSCCFGGPELKHLYITTAGRLDEERSAAQPLAGGLFVCETPVAGLPMYAFRG